MKGREEWEWHETYDRKKVHFTLRVIRGTGRGNPGVMGARRLREEGEEGAGDGIPKRAGAERNRK